MNNNLTQWKKRLIIFQFIYSYLLSDWDKNEFLAKMKLNNYYQDEYIFNTLITFFNKNINYKEIIQNNISEKWQYDRISNVDKAIIFTSLAESEFFKIEKKIIIDQAIITAKKYGEPNSYKFINYILDKVL